MGFAAIKHELSRRRCRRCFLWAWQKGGNKEVLYNSQLFWLFVIEFFFLFRFVLVSC